MLNLLFGIGIGLVVALLVGAVMKRKYRKELDAVLGFDWDMDGESYELVTQIKERIKKKLGK